MQRISVDFSRGESPERIEVGFGDSWQSKNVALREGEQVILYDSSLEVHGVLYQEIRLGKPYWFAMPALDARSVTTDAPMSADAFAAALGMSPEDVARADAEARERYPEAFGQ